MDSPANIEKMKWRVKHLTTDLDLQEMVLTEHETLFKTLDSALGETGEKINSLNGDLICLKIKLHSFVQKCDAVDLKFLESCKQKDAEIARKDEEIAAIARELQRLRQQGRPDEERSADEPNAKRLRTSSPAQDEDHDS